jgi:hypothetical protein
MVQRTDPQSRREREQSLRQRLGVPDDAGRVIVFAESSHWDPNWLRTSDEYFHRLVGPNLDRAIDELLREPRRVYSVECMFFLRMYWEHRPDRRDSVRELVNEGRLRLMSSGVTTADTLLPGTEAILRDFVIGQEWLRSNGMTQEPRLAYFPDSFGHSPGLPSLLVAAGFDMAAITRIDGMYFVGADYELRRRFPRRGSSAARLMNEERSLDFVWRAADGAEVLCHWNAFTYGQGDMLAHRGLTRVYLFPAAFPDRSDRNVAGKIRRFTAQLMPLSRTPYLFCPIGFDFVGPIPDLAGLLGRYNRLHYPATGVWACNAGLDDYLALVDCHRDELPVIDLDPNPYWTGFYTSRPTLKKKCHETVELLLMAEILAMLPDNAGQDRAVAAELEEAWWDAVVANHHDFITGTSPDRVVEAEQEPWLDRAADTARAAVARLAPHIQSDEREKLPQPPEWRSHGGRIEVRTAHYVVELDDEAGGCIVSARHPVSGRTLLRGPSNDLVSYKDSGGLWRMGHEFRGGVFNEGCRASDRSARLEVHEREDGLEVACRTVLDGEMFDRLTWFGGDSPVIRFRVSGRAAERRTVTARFATGVSPHTLVMDANGAVVTRPLQRQYDPTYWPVQSFVHLPAEVNDSGLALCLRAPGAVSCRPDGILEVVALRNAVRERAFGIIPLPAMPASGHERSACEFDYAVLFTGPGDWSSNGLPLVASRMPDGPWDENGGAGLRPLARSAVEVDRPDVDVIAVKPASRGDGIIVRLYAPGSPGSRALLRIAGRAMEAASLCDARERDLRALRVEKGTVHVEMPGTIATIRVVLSL